MKYNMIILLSFATTISIGRTMLPPLRAEQPAKEDAGKWKAERKPTQSRCTLVFTDQSKEVYSNSSTCLILHPSGGVRCQGSLRQPVLSKEQVIEFVTSNPDKLPPDKPLELNLLINNKVTMETLQAFVADVSNGLPDGKKVTIYLIPNNRE